jgi:hypothetical protein
MNVRDSEREHCNGLVCISGRRRGIPQDAPYCSGCEHHWYGFLPHAHVDPEFHKIQAVGYRKKHLALEGVNITGTASCPAWP